MLNSRQQNICKISRKNCRAFVIYVYWREISGSVCGKLDLVAMLIKVWYSYTKSFVRYAYVGARCWMGISWSGKSGFCRIWCDLFLTHIPIFYDSLFYIGNSFVIWIALCIMNEAYLPLQYTYIKDL